MTKTEKPTEEWVTPSEAARMLGIGVARVRQLADAGELTCNRTALGRLISTASVNALAAERAAR